MFIRDYALPEHLAHRVLVGDDLEWPIEADRGRPPSIAPDLLVWRGAFCQPGLLAHFEHPHWPLDLLDALPCPTWPWILLMRREMQMDPADILRRTIAAAGVSGPPEGNIHLKLEIRRWEDRATAIGGLDWWLERAQEVAQRNSFGAVLIAALIGVLITATQRGVPLFTDQLSIVLTKHPQSPASGIAPLLHSDRAYGHRESAITSLLEKGWDACGGALYVPGRRMSELQSLLPITVQDIDRKLSREAVLMSQSGDLLIYDGMLSPSGQSHAQLGIPHLSAELPGRAARLAILMYQPVTSRTRPYRESSALTQKHLR